MTDVRRGQTTALTELAIAAGVTARTDRCVEWRHYAAAGRWPAVRRGGRQGKVRSVRRIVAERAGIDVHPGQVVTTTCGTKRCINPRHFEITTVAEIGSRSRVVSVDEAAAIAELYRTSGASIRALADELNLDRGVVWRSIRAERTA